VKDLPAAKTRLTEFRCGHTHDAVDEFSGHEDGLTLHEAGHLLFRDGEYSAALVCMERSAERGNIWGDRDTVVVKEAWEVAEQALKGLTADTATPEPIGEQIVDHGKYRRLLSGAAYAGALSVAVAAATVVVVHLAPPATPTTPGRPAGPQMTNNQLSSIILQAQPDSSATPLRLTERAAVPTPGTGAPSSDAHAPARPPRDGMAPGTGAPADNRSELRAPNENGGWSVAYVARGASDLTSRRQMRWATKPGSSFFGTLQSPKAVTCTWSFHGANRSGERFSSPTVEVAPGEATKVKVPLRSSSTMAAVVTSDNPRTDCFMVDPHFEPTGAAEPAPSASPR